MPSIEIRPAIKNDLDTMLALEHSLATSRAWQMEQVFESGQISIRFREVNLPRSLRLAYPRKPDIIRQEWDDRSLILVACSHGKIIGYMDLIYPPASNLAWVLDIVVKEDHRRQGIGSALLMAAYEWAAARGYSHIILEMMNKNHPAICMAMKYGFDFCGFNDRYYSNKDIALFFQRSFI